MINSLDEQQFIEKLLLDEKIVQEIWLGAKRDSKTKKFHWDDVMHTNFTYENWGQLSNETDFECVEMMPKGIQKGKWIDTSCDKKNLVVCQKMQVLTLVRLQKEFLDFKKQYQIETIQTKTKFENEISKLKQAVVPIGFIYTQLPNQAEPTLIWPKLKWQFVTSQYADTFFRAQGNKTAPFCQVQSQGAPRLSKVNITRTDNWATTNEHLQDIITVSYTHLTLPTIYSV